MSYVLRYTNAFAEVFYFVRSGNVYHGQLLIEKTSLSLADAKQFSTAPEAAMVIADAGNPAGWEIVPL